MTDPFRDPDQGAFLNFLNSIDRPGQVVRNLIKGNGKGALRQAGQFGMDVLDSILPGDWLPNDLAQPEDYVSGGDLAGIDHKAHPFLGTVADVGLGMLTDPLTYIPGAAIAKGLGAAGKLGARAIQVADKVLPGAAKTAEKAGEVVRSTFGAPKVSEANQAVLNRATAARSNVTRAGLDETGRIMNGLSENEQNIVGDIIDNHRWQDGKLVGRLTQKPNSVIVPGSTFEDTSTALDRIDLHPEVNAQNRDRIAKAVEEIVGKDNKMGFSQRQAQEGIDRGIFKEAQNTSDVKPGVTEGVSDELNYRGSVHNDELVPVSKGIDRFRKDYLQRIISGQTEDDVAGEILGNPSAVKGLKLETPEATAEFLDKNPGATYERNAAKRLARRAEEQGKLAQRAEIGRSIQKGFAYADEGARKAVTDQLMQLPTEEREVMMNAFKGMPPRSTPMQWLASSNRFFKPFAVYGAAIPKMGSIVRNRLTGVWQAASNPESRGTAFQMLKRMPSDLADAVTQSLGLKNLATGELANTLNAVDDAFRASGGVADNAMNLLRQAGHGKVADLMNAGGLNGFVTSEDLLAQMARTPLKKKMMSVMDFPGKIFKWTEDQMRLGMGLDLMNSGKSAEEAAKTIGESLYNYDVTTLANRRARDFIPFFQFSAKAIPQQLKFMAEKPAVAVGLAEALQQRPDEPIYPWQEGKINIPLGQDTEGNSQYASGLGLPFEQLSNIPDSARSFKKNVIGSSQPVLKSALSAIFGQDPYFETPYGEYDKVPPFGHLGKAGKVYNEVAGTGMIQPIESLLQTIGQATDPRHSAGTKALDLLTGVNIRDVNPDLALQQQIQDAIKNNPDIQTFSSPYTQSTDPATLELLDQLKSAKKRLKAKKASQK